MANSPSFPHWLRRSAAESNNAAGGDPPIHFAAGFALSSEYPGLSRKELLTVADSKMYLDKQSWYAEKAN